MEKPSSVPQWRDSSTLDAFQGFMGLGLIGIGAAMLSVPGALILCGLLLWRNATAPKPADSKPAKGLDA